MGKTTKKEEEKKEEEKKEELNEWGIRGTTLYAHQQNNVIKMEKFEEVKERIYNDNTTTIKIHSSMGILNDKVGSGKTLTTISLLSRDKLKDKKETTFKYPWITDMGSNHYFSYTIEEERSFKLINLNVIVVSSSLFNQWVKEVHRSDLKYYTIVKNIDISNITKEILNSLDVIIVTYNRYRDFSDRFNHLYNYVNVGIKRLIFDEIQLRGRIPLAKAQFYWIISATLPNEYEDISHRMYDANAICRLLKNAKYKYISVKNTEEELKQSYQQAQMIEKKYVCYNIQFNMYGSLVTNEVQRMIAADDIAGAIIALGGTRDNCSLMDIIIKKEMDKLSHIKAQISYYTTLNNIDKIEEYNKKLLAGEKELENLKEKIQRDTEEDNTCPLCIEEFEEQILTYCCKSILCSKCVKKIYQTTQKCPYCRTTLNMKNMVISSKKESPKKEEKKELRMSKTEVVKNIINSNKDGKFILFSEFSNTFDMIQNALKEANIPFAEVKGTSDMKQKYIRLFKEGKLTVLFLNSRNDGSGIDLPEATDVILYHKMSSKDIETQVLGRALRLGRTKPLTVHRLLYKDEEQMDDNVRNLGHLHRSHLPPSHESEDNNEQQEYQRRLREEQEQEDRELAMRLQAELNT